MDQYSRLMAAMEMRSDTSSAVSAIPESIFDEHD
jgi:hypothetical protein